MSATARWACALAEILVSVCKLSGVVALAQPSQPPAPPPSSAPSSSQYDGFALDDLESFRAASRRATYLRVNCERRILALAHSAHPANPNRPPRGQPVKSGVTFHDISDPRSPKLLGEWNNPGGLTHGIAMDEGYVYACGTGLLSKPRHERTATAGT